MNARRYLHVAEKPAIARALTDVFASGGIRRETVDGPSKYNPNFVFEYPKPFSNCPPGQFRITSVSGHIYEVLFEESVSKWQSTPILTLLDCQVHRSVSHDSRSIARNITTQSKYCTDLVLWLDADLEGEAIAADVRSVAVAAQPTLRVHRARFADTTATSLLRALNSLGVVDEAQVAAVGLRSELDLRFGAALTRWQTLLLQDLVKPASRGGRFSRGNAKSHKQVLLSYGPCQFPTLGFVVSRHQEIAEFIPENTYTVELTVTVNRHVVRVTHTDGPFYAQPLAAGVCTELELALRRAPAQVTAVRDKHRVVQRPLPPNTLDLQKGLARRGMSSRAVTKAAESLYTKGLISYPRTDTRSLPLEMAIAAVEATRALTGTPELETISSIARGLTFRPPRQSSRSDNAHPAIHPVRAARPGDLTGDVEAAVYSWVCRRHLAACGPDAQAIDRKLRVECAGHDFEAASSQITVRGWMDIVGAPIERGKDLPMVADGTPCSRAVPAVKVGRTEPPHQLTEADLLELMDEHGIGTDATAAQHIATIIDREYVTLTARKLAPTQLGLAIARAYADIDDRGALLVEPLLRAEFELQLQAVAASEMPSAAARASAMERMRPLIQNVVNRQVEFKMLVKGYLMAGNNQL